MVQTANTPAMTVEEYIQSEWKAERRHEFINGNLFEMPDEKDINNEMALLIAMQLLKSLPKGHKVYSHDMKIAIPGGRKFYYPDVFVTAEPKSPGNQYIKTAPVLVVEVVSPGSQTHDYVNKYLYYIQMPSLEYYLIAEPETLLITVYERDGTEWIARKYTKLDEQIALPKLNLNLSMLEIYEGLRS